MCYNLTHGDVVEYKRIPYPKRYPQQTNKQTNKNRTVTRLKSSPCVIQEDFSSAFSIGSMVELFLIYSGVEN